MAANPFLDWREKQGLGPTEAAVKCAVERQTWWRWETGASRVAIEKLERVEAVTGIPREQLRPDIFGEAVQ